MNNPKVWVVEATHSDDYYAFYVTLYGKSGKKLHEAYFNNDDMSNRGFSGYAHKAAVSYAKHLCDELDLSHGRVRITYLKDNEDE